MAIFAPTIKQLDWGMIYVFLVSYWVTDVTFEQLLGLSWLRLKSTYEKAGILGFNYHKRSTLFYDWTGWFWFSEAPRCGKL
jgi:hypothetical protein